MATVADCVIYVKLYGALPDVVDGLYFSSTGKQNDVGSAQNIGAMESLRTHTHNHGFVYNQLTIEKTQEP